MNWKKQTENFLFTKKAPRILTKKNLLAITQEYKPDISNSSLDKWIHEQVSSERFDRIRSGVYVNNLTYPVVNPLEAIPYAVPGAVVSLQFVLGEFGIMNNYTDIATCVVPSKTHLPRIQSRSLRFQFNMMLEDVLNAGEEKDRLLDDREYPMATPEKAFLDMLYLGNHGKSRLTVPPMDCDIENLRKRRLNRLIKAMGIEKEFKDWAEKKKAFDDDPDVEGNMSIGLGF